MGNNACRQCEEVTKQKQGEVEVGGGRGGLPSNGVKKITNLPKMVDYTIQKIAPNKTRIVYSTGEIYQGETISGNIKHGRGRLQWPYGGYYEGQWVNDIASGRGVFCQNGDTYEGIFSNNRYLKVVYTSSDGLTTYQGEYNSQRREHGRGELVKKGQYRYVGEFVDGMKQGRGRIVFEKGGEYEGGFVRGRFEGEGRFKGEGFEYEGGWRQGECHGRGRYTWASGAYYEGEYKLGQKDGEGVYVSSQGTKYEGPFVGGKRHGKGYETGLDGVKQQVWFENGVRLLSDPE